METLTATERMEKHIYQMAKEIWGIDMTKLDMEFFNSYISFYNDKKIIKNSYDKFYSALRFSDFHNFTEADNRARLQSSLTEVAKDDKDRNIELYRSRIKSYYIKLLEGSTLLNTLTNNWEEKRINSQVLKERFKTYVETLTVERFKTIQKHFGLDKRYYDKLETVKEKPLPFTKAMMKEAFGLDVKTATRGNQHVDRSNYRNETKVFDSSWFDDIVEKYNPYHLKI